MITPDPRVLFLFRDERGCLLVLRVITEDNASSISIEFEQEYKNKSISADNLFNQKFWSRCLPLDIVKKLYDVLAKEDICLDSIQLEFLNTYENQLFEKNDRSRFFRKKKENFPSVYLWGEVGRGKTLLLKNLSKLLTSNYLNIHFNEFMINVHEFLQENQGIKDPLRVFTKKVLRKVDVLFLDEFQIEDIGDAMIIGKVLTELNQTNTTIFLSSNYQVHDLYKSGLQREKFISSMKFIERDFLYFHLQGDIDYRSDKVHTFLSLEKKDINDSSMREFLINQFDKNANFLDKLILSNRKFSCKGFGKRFAWLDFQIFFHEPNIAKDYLELCKKHEWIFIDNFKKINDSELPLVRRFITFLDTTYSTGAKLCILDTRDSISMLYKGEALEHLWSRAKSRLQEALFIE
jgi:cell division protein ZapE